MSYDTFCVVMMHLRCSLKQHGDHIITGAEHSYNIWRSQIRNSKLTKGTKDFISKLEIALKECNESEYWLGLLFETNSQNARINRYYAEKQINDKAYKWLGSLIPSRFLQILQFCVATP